MQRRKYLNYIAYPVTGANRHRGFALVVVIVVLLLVSFLASQLILQVRTEHQIAFNVKNRSKSHFLSEAGLNVALFRLMDSPEDVVLGDDTFLHGYSYTNYLNTGKFSYYVTNESGKIDLNKAPRRLLELFLEYQGLEVEQIETIIDSLLDWQDADDLHRLNGAELETYQELADPYIPKNGSLDDPGDFFLIHGTSVLVGKFDPDEVFTIHNSSGKINFNSLTPAMLDFLVEGDFDRKQAYKEAQQLYITLNQAMARQILGDERYDEIKDFLSFSSNTAQSNQYYSIAAYGQAGVKPPENEDEEPPTVPGVKINVLIRLESSIRYQLLSWKEKYA